MENIQDIISNIKHTVETHFIGTGAYASMSRASRQTPHRFEEVRDRLRRFRDEYVAFFRTVDWEKDDAINDLHMLFGAVCALAELQQSLRGELLTDRPLRLVLDRRPFI